MTKFLYLSQNFIVREKMIDIIKYHKHCFQRDRGGRGEVFLLFPGALGVILVLNWRER